MTSKKKAGKRRQKDNTEQRHDANVEDPKNKKMPLRFPLPPYDQQPYEKRPNLLRQLPTDRQLEAMALLQAEMFNRPCLNPTHKHTMVSDAECLQLFRHMNEINCRKPDCDCAKNYSAEQKRSIKEAFVGLPGMCMLYEKKRRRSQREWLLKKYSAASKVSHPWKGRYIDPEEPYHHKFDLEGEADRLAELMMNDDLDKELVYRSKSMHRLLYDSRQSLERLRLVYDRLHDMPKDSDTRAPMTKAARLAQKLMLGANEFDLRMKFKAAREVSNPPSYQQVQSTPQQQEEQSSDLQQGEQSGDSHEAQVQAEQSVEHRSGAYRSVIGDAATTGKGKQPAASTEHGLSDGDVDSQLLAEVLAGGPRGWKAFHKGDREFKDAVVDAMMEKATERGMMIGSVLVLKWPSAVNPIEECLSAIATKGKMHCQPGLPCPSCKYVRAVNESIENVMEPESCAKHGSDSWWICERQGPIKDESVEQSDAGNEVIVDPLEGSSKKRDEVLKDNGIA